MNICIIPARGGSRRIARKNIRPFCGRPVIAYSVQAAARSGCFARIAVSTDDEEIAETARRFGAEVPFVRPAELAGDFATTGDVMQHAARMLLDGLPPDEAAAAKLCCLYAAAPLASPEDLRSGLALLEGKPDADYAFAATRYPYPIQRALRRADDGCVGMLHPELFSTRSQDLEEAWHDAGQFYWGTAAAWLDARPVFNSRAYAVALPRWRVQDIDTEEDWAQAEILYRMLNADKP